MSSAQTSNEDTLIISTVFKLPDGSTGSPALLFSNDEDTGIYRESDNTIGFAGGGSKICEMSDSSGLTVDNLNVNDNTLNATSGNLVLASTSGTVEVADNTNVTGTLSCSSTLTVDTINEFTGANGVTVDGVSIKDTTVITGATTLKSGQVISTGNLSLECANGSDLYIQAAAGEYSMTFERYLTTSSKRLVHNPNVSITTNPEVDDTAFTGAFMHIGGGTYTTAAKTGSSTENIALWAFAASTVNKTGISMDVNTITNMYVAAEPTIGTGITVNGQTWSSHVAGDVRMDKQLLVGNTSATASANTTLHVYDDSGTTTPLILCEQDGAGDAAVRFLLSGGAGWAMGMDNDDSDLFKLSYNATGTSAVLGTGDVISCSSSAVNLLQNTSVTGTLSCDTSFTIDSVSIGAAALEFANDLDQQLTTGSSVTFASVTDGTATLTSGGLTGLTNLTVNNLNANGNTLNATSGNLTLASTSGKVKVSDDTDISGKTKVITDLGTDILAGGDPSNDDCAQLSLQAITKLNSNDVILRMGISPTGTAGMAFIQGVNSFITAQIPLILNPNGGTVSIGTSTSTKKLYVYDNSADHVAHFHNANASGYGMIISADLDPLRVGTKSDTSGNLLKVDGSGNTTIAGYVTVNTLSRIGSFELDVNGDAIIQSNLFIDRGTAETSTSLSLAIGDNDTGLDWVSDGQFRVMCNSVDVARWDPTGLGLGTQPSYSLHSDTTDGYNIIATNSANSAWNEIGCWAGSTNQVKAQIQAFETTSSRVQFGSRSNHPVIFSMNDTEYARLHTNGYFGVYVTPQKRFHVKDTGTDHVAWFESTNAGGYGVTISAANDPLRVGGVGDIAGGYFTVASTGVYCGVTLFATADNAIDIGSSSRRWKAGFFVDVYTVDGTVQTSDRNDKTNFGEVMGLSFLRRLSPVSYQWKTGKRRHYGLIAQDVETVMNESGIASSDFAPLVKSKGKYGLRYQQFIPIIIQSVQDMDDIQTTQAKEIAELRRENQEQNVLIQSLIERIEALEARTKE